MKRLIAVLLIATLFIVGCANTSPLTPTTHTDKVGQSRIAAYKALASMSATYNAVMNTMGDLYRQGKIDEATKVKAIELGKNFKRAHDVAIDVMAVSDNFDLSLVATTLDELVKFASGYMKKGV